MPLRQVNISKCSGVLSDELVQPQVKCQSARVEGCCATICSTLNRNLLRSCRTSDNCGRNGRRLPAVRRKVGSRQNIELPPRYRLTILLPEHPEAPVKHMGPRVTTS